MTYYIIFLFKLFVLCKVFYYLWKCTDAITEFESSIESPCDKRVRAGRNKKTI